MTNYNMPVERKGTTWTVDIAEVIAQEWCLRNEGACEGDCLATIPKETLQEILYSIDDFTLWMYESAVETAQHFLDEMEEETQ